MQNPSLTLRARNAGGGGRSLWLAFAFASIALSVGLFGCGSIPEPGWESVLEDAIEDRAGDFAAGWEILAGFDPVDPGDPLTVGDALLYGIRSDVGARRRVWYLLVSVDAITTQRRLEFRAVQAFEQRVTTARRRHAEAARLAERDLGEKHSFDLDDFLSEMPVARVRVEAFDQAGASLGTATSEESVERLRTGLWSACVAGHAQRDRMRGWSAPERQHDVIEVDEATYTDIETVAEGIAACDSFFSIIEQNPVTQRILFDVIALPSLWSILMNFGVTAAFEINFFAADRVEPTRAPNASGEVWSAPLTIELNDQPALVARILAAPTTGPAAAAAGVYGIIGRHPTDPDRRVHVQLLASRRGVRR